MKIRKNIAISETGFVFNSVSGESFSLNETAREIISYLQQGKSESEIKEIFLDSYDIDSNTFERSFLDFIAMLKQYQLTTTDEEN